MHLNLVQGLAWPELPKFPDARPDAKMAEMPKCAQITLDPKGARDMRPIAELLMPRSVQVRSQEWSGCCHCLVLTTPAMLSSGQCLHKCADRIWLVCMVSQTSQWQEHDLCTQGQQFTDSS